MTYNIYLQETTVDSLLAEFSLGSDHLISSTSNFGDTLPISTIAGDSSITLSNNTITLPQGYEFIFRFFVGIERASIGTYIYTKLFYSDGSAVQNSTISEINGSGGNKSSIEETCAIINTDSGSKEIIIKAYKSDSSATSFLDSICYGYILGFKRWRIYKKTIILAS